MLSTLALTADAFSWSGIIISRWYPHVRAPFSLSIVHTDHTDHTDHELVTPKQTQWGQSVPQLELLIVACVVISLELPISMYCRLIGLKEGPSQLKECNATVDVNTGRH